MIPRMLSNIKQVDAIRKLSPGEVRRLILSNRLRLRDVA
jgi:hypothetical protein